MFLSRGRLRGRMTESPPRISEEPEARELTRKLREKIEYYYDRYREKKEKGELQ